MMIRRRHFAGLTLQYSDGDYTGYINGQAITFSAPTVNRWIGTIDDQEVAKGFTLTMCVNAAKENLA